MRVAPLCLALASAAFFACAGNETFTAGGAPPIGSQLGDAGTTVADAGTDGGVTDGGTGTCSPQALPFGQVNSTDTCESGAATTATVIAASCSDVTIAVTDGLNCSGTLTGTGNAFSGSCNALPCSSIHLPGLITCTQLNSQPCTVEICDSAGNCPNP
jgi:hypothetical protein